MAEVTRNDSFSILVAAGTDTTSIKLVVNDTTMVAAVVNGVATFPFAGGLAQAGTYGLSAVGINADGEGPALTGELTILKKLPGKPNSFTVILGV